MIPKPNKTLPRLKLALPLALAAACISLETAQAGIYTETGDAGDLLGTAQTAAGAANTSLTAINGTLTLTNGISDSDLFKIYISTPAAFSATLTNFVAGSNNFDSQISLFNASGVGIYSNDDAASGGSQSTLPAGTSFMTGRTPGVYYLLISGSGRYATDSAGNLIFPNFTTGADPTDTTGAISTNALAGYTGSSNEGGKYSVALTGAQFVTAAVPEPSTTAFALAGMAGLTLVFRGRRKA